MAPINTNHKQLVALTLLVQRVANTFMRGLNCISADTPHQESAELLVVRYQQGTQYIDVHLDVKDGAWCVGSPDLRLDTPEQIYFKYTAHNLGWAGLTTEAYNLVQDMLQSPPAASWLIRGAKIIHTYRVGQANADTGSHLDLSVTPLYMRQSYCAVSPAIFDELPQWPVALQKYLEPLHKVTKTQRELMASLVTVTGEAGVYLLLTYEDGELSSNVIAVRPGQMKLCDVFELYASRRDKKTTYKLCKLPLPDFHVDVVALVRECPNWALWGDMAGKPALVMYDVTSGNSRPVSVKPLPKKLLSLVNRLLTVTGTPGMFIDIGTKAASSNLPLHQSDHCRFSLSLDMFQQVLECRQHNHLHRSLVVLDTAGPWLNVFRWLVRTGLDSFELAICHINTDTQEVYSSDWLTIAARLAQTNIGKVLLEQQSWLGGKWGPDVQSLFQGTYSEDV